MAERCTAQKQSGPSNPIGIGCGWWTDRQVPGGRASRSQERGQVGPRKEGRQVLGIRSGAAGLSLPLPSLDTLSPPQISWGQTPGKGRWMSWLYFSGSGKGWYMKRFIETGEVLRLRRNQTGAIAPTQGPFGALEAPREDAGY